MKFGGLLNKPVGVAKDRNPDGTQKEFAKGGRKRIYQSDMLSVSPREYKPSKLSPTKQSISRIETPTETVATTPKSNSRLSTYTNYAPEAAGFVAGIGSNLSNRALIADRQKLLDNLPDQQLTPMFTPKLIQPGYNPVMRANRAFQLGLDQTTSASSVNANKLSAQAQLYDSINKTQTDINTANTSIQNDAGLTNTNIAKGNNEITLNNYLRKLRGQDDIIRDKSEANANLADVTNNTMANISTRNVSQNQQRLNFLTADPKVQRYVASKDRNGLKSVGLSDDEIDNILNKKRYGGKLYNKVRS